MKTIASALMVAALAACAQAQPPAPGSSQAPGSAPAPAPGTTPAAAPPSARAGVSEPAETAEAWLERIEAAADDVETIRAKANLRTVQGLLGDEQRRFGTLVYDAADEAGAEPVRFRLDFDRVVVDEQLQQQDRAYIFDGVWLAERLGDQRTFIRRQLVAEGEQGPSLDLGDGPFALPLNLQKDKVLQRFDVTLMPPDAGDPADTVRLRLVPKEGVDVDDEQIDVWFERERLVPVRVRTVKEDETEQTLDLREIEVNAPLDEAAFDTSPPDEAGWAVEENPLQ